MRSKSGRRPLFGVHHHCRDSISLGHLIKWDQSPILIRKQYWGKVDFQTTIGLHSNDYWFGGQITIRFAYELIAVRIWNHYWTERKQLLQQLCPLYYCFTHRPIAKQYPAGKTEVVHTIIPLRSDTQTLRLIASTSLIQRREKHHSREEKSVFP